MVPDNLSRLLTAFVDKDLEPDERQAVIGLLRRSKEARTLLLQLHDDARALRSLPPVAPAEDFSEKVLKRIAEQKVRIARQPIPKVRAPIPAWLGLATAATILVALGAGISLFMMGDRADRVIVDRSEPATSTELAKAPPVVSHPPSKPSSSIQIVKRSDTSPTDPAKSTASAKPAPRDSERVAKAVRPRAENRKAPADLPYVSPTKPPLVVEKVKIDVPAFLPLRELNQEERRRQFLAELEKVNACRLELPCLKPREGLLQLRRVLEDQGVAFLLDQDAAARIKVPFPNFSYALYLQNLTADEIFSVFRQIGTEPDPKVKTKSRALPGFDKVSVKAMASDDCAHFSKLLGLDPLQLKPRSLDGIAGQFRKMGQSRSELGPLENEIQERTAVVVVDYESGDRPISSPLSAEIKHFFGTRHERLPGSLDVLIFVRSANGR
jgi:hypothetical protein